MALHLSKLIGTDTSELTIASGEITITGLHHTVASETGTTDTLSAVNVDATLLASMASKPFFVWLHAKQGHTITVEDGTTSISVYAFCGTNMTMTENEGLLLFYNPGGNEGWTGIGSPVGTIVLATAVQTLTQKTLNQPVILWQNTEFASGAISLFNGHALLTGGSATTYTLADPATPADDGKEVTIYSKTAFAHKIDNSAGSGFDGGGASLDFANFGGAVGDNIVLFADAGVWRVKSTRNVTIAAS